MERIEKTSMRSLRVCFITKKHELIDRCHGCTRVAYTEIVGAHWHQGQNVVSFLNTDMNDEILQSF